jgi:hypothetical protein
MSSLKPANIVVKTTKPKGAVVPVAPIKGIAKPDAIDPATVKELTALGLLVNREGRLMLTDAGKVQAKLAVAEANQSDEDPVVITPEGRAAIAAVKAQARKMEAYNAAREELIKTPITKLTTKMEDLLLRIAEAGPKGYTPQNAWEWSTCLRMEGDLTRIS